MGKNTRHNPYSIIKKSMTFWILILYWMPWQHWRLLLTRSMGKLISCVTSFPDAEYNKPEEGWKVKGKVEERRLLEQPLQSTDRSDHLWLQVDRREEETDTDQASTIWQVLCDVPQIQDAFLSFQPLLCIRNFPHFFQIQSLGLKEVKYLTRGHTVANGKPGLGHRSDGF